jgi:hypothetical protein
MLVGYHLLLLREFGPYLLIIMNVLLHVTAAMIW